HVIVGLDVGGAELMLQRLLRAQLRTSTNRHIVVSLTSLGPVGTQMREQGIMVIPLGMRSGIHAPTALFRLVRCFRELQPDIVQTWMYHADLLGGLAARLAKVPVVIWGIRTTDVAKGGSRVTPMIRWLCARSSAVIPDKIVCAAEAARRLHVALGYRADRMLVIPNGLDIGSWNPASEDGAQLRRQLGIDESACTVGTLGRFSHVKDQHNFVRAAGIVGARDTRVRFLMVGRDCDWENRQLVAWIGQTRLADRFILLGQRSDPAVCMAAMEVFVLPSRTEGFPNVLAEAMAMGRPCVTTDVGDAASLLGSCGLVSPPEDSSALAESIVRMLGLPSAERDAFGRSARARIVQEYSMERCNERFENLYATTLAVARAWRSR
ncbi:glycosyltransferase family 4 protein, partial [Ramlibacter sp.]|uniref:glycosyltransferase family 4 protein n=1 Tax=Ramlibacter sp. TaxID=1917967 RepID=UPI002C4728D1